MVSDEARNAGPIGGEHSPLSTLLDLIPEHRVFQMGRKKHGYPHEMPVHKRIIGEDELARQDGLSLKSAQNRFILA
jgi:hypothetical protein